MPVVSVTREQAKETYLAIYREFAIDEKEVNDVVAKALEANGLITLSDVNGEYNVWQSWKTYDGTDEAGALAYFDEAWPESMPEFVVHGTAIPNAPKTKAPNTGPQVRYVNAYCLCGCGEAPIGRKSYRPGHDARHASQVARRVLGGEPATIIGGELSTEALQQKAWAQVKRSNNKAVTSRADAISVPIADGVVHGYVTRNRIKIPAHTMLVSGEQRMNINNDADGSGDWLDAEGYDGKTQNYWLKRFHPTVQRVTPVKSAPKRARRPGGDGPESLKSLLTF